MISIKLVILLCVDIALANSVPPQTITYTNDDATTMVNAIKTLFDNYAHHLSTCSGYSCEAYKYPADWNQMDNSKSIEFDAFTKWATSIYKYYHFFIHRPPISTALTSDQRNGLIVAIKQYYTVANGVIANHIPIKDLLDKEITELQNGQ